MLGIKMRFSDIPEDGLVESGKKKKDYWYNVYKFTEEQEKEWRDWALEELRKACSDDKRVMEVFREVDMHYGFVIRYKKKGELF